MEKWLEMIAQILLGLIVIIPLVKKLIAVVKENVEEKNWDKIVKAMLDLMVEAEQQFTEGAAKKAWVMTGVRLVAETVNYEYDAVAEKKISEMIDAICDASKILNKNIGEE